MDSLQTIQDQLTLREYQKVVQRSGSAASCLTPAHLLKPITGSQTTISILTVIAARKILMKFQRRTVQRAASAINGDCRPKRPSRIVNQSYVERVGSWVCQKIAKGLCILSSGISSQYGMLRLPYDIAGPCEFYNARRRTLYILALISTLEYFIHLLPLLFSFSSPSSPLSL